VQNVWNDLMQIDQANVHALAISLGAIVVTVSSRWISKKVPGALLAVVGAIALSWALDLERYMSVLGPVPGGLPRIGLPEAQWSWQLLVTLAPTAFAMFVVILAQSAATSRAYAARYNERFNENTDLVGLGIANIGAGLSGAFVVNGSPTKTQMVDSAGGRSQLSLLVTSIVVLLVLLFLTGPLAYMPEAVLSAVVFLIGIDLVDLKGMRNVFRQRRSEFWVALLTALTVIFVGVGQGILLAIVLSLIDHTRHGYRPRNVVLVPEPSGVWRPRPVASGAQAQPGLVIYRFNHSMYYANCGQLTEEIMSLADHAQPALRWFCIEVSAVDDVDYSASEALRSLCDTLRDRGVRLVVAQVLDDTDETSQSGFRQLVGDAGVYPTLQDVMRAFRSEARP
jgi:MFS superfamily sulfate permease-like transporter